jgi:hypothetical protein
MKSMKRGTVSGWLKAADCYEHKYNRLSFHPFVRPVPSFLYVFLAVLEMVAPRGTQRSGERMHAPRGDGPNGAILLDRADSPGATTFFACHDSHESTWDGPRAPTERPRPMPSGETAPLSASTGTGWGCGGSCVRVHDQQARLA